MISQQDTVRKKKRNGRITRLSCLFFFFFFLFVVVVVVVMCQIIRGDGVWMGAKRKAEREGDSCCCPTDSVCVSNYSENVNRISFSSPFLSFGCEDAKVFGFLSIVHFDSRTPFSDFERETLSPVLLLLLLLLFWS
jgi:hypothetical protein